MDAYASGRQRRVDACGQSGRPADAACLCLCRAAHLLAHAEHARLEGELREVGAAVALRVERQALEVDLLAPQRRVGAAGPSAAGGVARRGREARGARVQLYVDLWVDRGKRIALRLGPNASN